MRYFAFLLSCLFSLVTIAQPDTPKQGYIKKKGQDGKLIYEGEFRNDKPVGRFRYYYPNDSVRAIMDFKNEGKIAYAKLFHTNGKRMAQGKYINREVKDSTWLYYDEAGVLISKDNYKAGKKHGTCFVYLPDGKTSEERNYREDVLNGEFRDYFSDGALRAKGQYRNGLMEGRVAYYYPNGVEVAAGYYRNGEKNGPWLYRTESNKVRERELYRNGVLAPEKETQEFFSRHPADNEKEKNTNTANKAAKESPKKK